MSRNRVIISALTTLLIAGFAAVGCDDGTGQGGAGGGTSSSTGSSTATNGSTSGSTSSASGSGSTSSGSMSSSGSASSSNAASSSSSGGSMKLNNCEEATADDHTGEQLVKVSFGGVLGSVYSPPCIKISAGAQVSFSGDFSFHPLRGGQVVGMTLMPDATSPIQPTDAGMAATFTFPSAGDFGFYCNFHGPFGMAGAVFVQ